MAIPMTEKLARACATDAANAVMRRAGREAWNSDDFTVAVRTFDLLWPEAQAYAALIGDFLGGNTDSPQLDHRASRA